MYRVPKPKNLGSKLDQKTHSSTKPTKPCKPVTKRRASIVSKRTFNIAIASGNSLTKSKSHFSSSSSSSSSATAPRLTPCKTPLDQMTPEDVIIAQNPVRLHFRKYPAIFSLDSSSAPGDDSTKTKKPPLFILHGLLGQANNWSSIATRPAIRYQRDIYTIDLRNHGQSSQCTYMDYIAMSNDIANLIKTECPDQVATLVGHSMGGKVVAATGLRHPQLTTGICLVDIIPLDYGPRTGTGMDGVFGILTAVSRVDLNIAKTRQDVDNLLEKEGIGEYGLRQWLGTNLSRIKYEEDGEGNSGGNNDQILPNKPVFEWRCNVKSLLDCYDMIRGFNLDPLNPDSSAKLNNTTTVYDKNQINSNNKIKFSQYRCPTHLILGGLSSFGKPATALDIMHENNFPECTLSVVQGAGHWVHSERPEEFTAELLGWLDKNGL